MFWTIEMTIDKCHLLLAVEGVGECVGGGERRGKGGDDVTSD